MKLKSHKKADEPETLGATEIDHRDERINQLKEALRYVIENVVQGNEALVKHLEGILRD